MEHSFLIVVANYLGGAVPDAKGSHVCRKWHAICHTQNSWLQIFLASVTHPWSISTEMQYHLCVIEEWLKWMNTLVFVSFQIIYTVLEKIQYVHPIRTKSEIVVLFKIKANLHIGLYEWNPLSSEICLVKYALCECVNIQTLLKQSFSLFNCIGPIGLKQCSNAHSNKWKHVFFHYAVHSFVLSTCTGTLNISRHYPLGWPACETANVRVRLSGDFIPQSP